MPLGLCFLLVRLQEALQRLQSWFPGLRDPCAKILSNIPRPLAPSHATFVEYLLPGPGFTFAGVFGSQGYLHPFSYSSWERELVVGADVTFTGSHS